MVKQVIRRVGVVSLAVISAVIGAIAGMIFGILVELGAAIPVIGTLWEGAIIGGLITGAVAGFILGAIGAILYNVATRFYEGVEIDLEPKK